MIINILAFLLQVISAQQLATKVNELQERLEGQQQTIIELTASQQITDKSLGQLSDIVEMSNSSISNALSTTNLILAIIGIMVAVATIFLGLYVGYMERKIRAMSDVVSKKEEEVKNLTTEVNSNIDKLFIRIQREDTKAYLKRLVEVPRDISNICSILLARRLEEEDYDTLKKAYLALKKNHDDKKRVGPYGTSGQLYSSLFFQHFPGKSILDEDIHQDIIDVFVIGIQAAFKNDIRKEVKEIGTVLSKKNGLEDREEVLFRLRKAIALSVDYKGDAEIQQLLKKAVNDEELWNSVEKRLREDNGGH